MRSVAFTAILALPLALAAAAPAAAQSYGPAPAPAGYGSPFTGLHVEGIIGGDRLQNNGHNDAFMYGIGGGYDLGMGRLIVGIEGEASDSNNRSCYGAFTVDDPRYCAKASRDLYVGGRLGTQVTPRAMIYALAGYTNARLKLTEDDGAGRYTLARTDLDGVRVGAGAEYAMSPNTFVKAEYRYSNYQDGFSRNQLVGGFGLRF